MDNNLVAMGAWESAAREAREAGLYWLPDLYLAVRDLRAEVERLKSAESVRPQSENAPPYFYVGPV